MKLVALLLLLSLSFVVGCAKSNSGSSNDSSKNEANLAADPTDDSRAIGLQIRPIDKTTSKSEIFGVWSSKDLENRDRNVDYFRDFVIEPGSLSMVLTCVFNEKTAVQAVIKTKAKVDDKRIELLEDGFDQVKFENQLCAGSVPKGSIFEYSYDSLTDTLTFKSGDGTEIKLSRNLESDNSL